MCFPVGCYDKYGNCTYCDCCRDCNCLRMRKNLINQKCYYCYKFHQGDNEPKYYFNLVCFNCRSTWKSGILKENVKCQYCQGIAFNVSSVVRVPSKNDIKGWKLLEKLLDITPFANSKPNTLAHYWYNNGGFGCTLHLSDNLRRQMAPPHNLYEYDEWVKKMKNEKLIL